MATFSASHLFSAIESREDFILLDVRNEDDFNQFKVEGPNDIDMLNIPYFDFIEDAEGSAALVPDGKPVLIVCAKVGSSEYVADVLTELGPRGCISSRRWNCIMGKCSCSKESK